jgi:hypothetical protein
MILGLAKLPNLILGLITVFDLIVDFFSIFWFLILILFKLNT